MRKINYMVVVYNDEITKKKFYEAHLPSPQFYTFLLFNFF